MTAPRRLQQDKKKSSRWKLFTKNRRKTKQGGGENEIFQSKSSSPPRSDATSATSGTNSAFLSRITSTKKRSDRSINVEENLFPDDEPMYAPPNIAPTEAPLADDKDRSEDTPFPSDPVKTPSLATSPADLSRVQEVEPCTRAVDLPSPKTETNVASVKTRALKGSATKSDLKSAVESPTSVISSVDEVTASSTTFSSDIRETTTSSEPFSSHLDAFGFPASLQPMMQDDDSWNTFSNPFPDVNAFQRISKPESNSQAPLEKPSPPCSVRGPVEPALLRKKTKTPSPTNVEKQSSASRLEPSARMCEKGPEEPSLLRNGPKTSSPTNVDKQPSASRLEPSSHIHKEAPEETVEPFSQRNGTKSTLKERKKAFVPSTAECESLRKDPDDKGSSQAPASHSETPATVRAAKATDTSMEECTPTRNQDSSERRTSEEVSPQRSLIRKMARARIAREAEEAKKAKCSEAMASPKSKVLASSQPNSPAKEAKEVEKKEVLVAMTRSSKMKQLKEKRNSWRTNKHSESSAPEASGANQGSHSKIHEPNEKAGCAPEEHSTAEQHDEFPLDEEPPKTSSTTSTLVPPAKEVAPVYSQPLPLPPSFDTDSSILRLMHSTSSDNGLAEVVGSRVQEDAASPRGTDLYMKRYHRQFTDKYESVEQDDDNVWDDIQPSEAEDSKDDQGDEDSLNLDLTDIVAVDSCLKDEIEVVVPEVNAKDALDKFEAYWTESETASCTSLGDSDAPDDDTKSYTTDGSRTSYDSRSSAGHSTHGESKHVRTKSVDSYYTSDAESSYEGDYDSEEEPVDSYFWENVAQLFVAPIYETM